MRTICDGQVGADLADDDGVARLTGLDDIDTQTFVCRASALTDMGFDAQVFVLVADVVFLVEALDGLRRRVRNEVMRASTTGLFNVTELTGWSKIAVDGRIIAGVYQYANGGHDIHIMIAPPYPDDLDRRGWRKGLDMAPL